MDSNSTPPKYRTRADLEHRNENLTYYVHIPQGIGGIYTFPLTLASDKHTQQHTTLIGTTGCSTCAGFYIPIDARRCFVAHFDGAITGREGMARSHILDDLIECFKRAVRQALDRTFQTVEHGVVENI